MEKLKISTSQNVSLEYTLAGVGERIIASIFDYLIIAAYYILFIVIFQITDASLNETGYVILSLPVLFYSLIFEIVLNGQTPGMKARKIKVTRIDGKSTGIGSYLLRWMFRLVDVALCFGGIATLMIAFTDKSQRIGDIVAGTTVVKIKDKISIRDTIYAATDNNYKPVYPSVTRLTDREIAIIREALSTYQKTKSRAAVEVLSRKLKNMLEIQTDASAPVFLEVLLKDYTHLTQTT